MSEIIRTQDLCHDFKLYDDEDNEIGVLEALKKVSIDIEEGTFLAVLGHNGSGKSTLAKHLNALLLPTDGLVYVCGRNTSEEKDIWKVRRDAGMIFQNPDNQIIGNIVEEDVAFGPENMGVPSEEILNRVAFALERAGMEAYRLSSPNQLSGGQKQRVAIAGMLAMRPRCILMDEPTAMLDPVGRREVLETVHELNRDYGITVVLITHYMEEAVDADRVIVMDKGRVCMDGTPREIFTRVEEMKILGMGVPQVTELAYELRKEGIDIPADIMTADEFTEALCRLR